MSQVRLSGTKVETALEAISPANAARFWAKVNKDGPILRPRSRLGSCWLWLGAARDTGYGVWRVGDAVAQAHRVAYTLMIGPIPPDRELHHRCHNPACVNPGHLEPVTIDEHRIRRKIRPQYGSSIREYETKSGRRWQVIFRVGSHMFTRSFTTKHEASKLKQLISEIGTLKTLQLLKAQED